EKTPYPFVRQRTKCFAGSDVEFRIVPGAGDDLPHQCALTQRPTLMSAGVVDGVEAASHVEKGNAPSLGLHDLASPWRYVLRLCDFHQPGHGGSSFRVILSLTTSRQHRKAAFASGSGWQRPAR